MSKPHKERAHSKFSASGAERWFNCPGSVELSEGIPDKPNVWAEEGTKAHEVLEALLLTYIRGGSVHLDKADGYTEEMISHGMVAADFIFKMGQRSDAEVLCEKKVYLDFIHPEMFGTYDGAVLDHFGTLHVFDYKFGAGHSVSPTKNLQMIFYGIGLAHKFQWNFKRVRLWIIQPRIKGYDGPVYWELTMDELKSYIIRFERAAAQAIATPHLYREGSWCHWCKAKVKCPLKQQAKDEKVIEIFKTNQGEKHGKKESKKENGFKEEAQKWREKAKIKSRTTDDFY